jgi:hypothetical protein
MTPQEMLEQMIDKATLEFLEIAKEEEDGDYSDAMLSMERTEAYGYSLGLSNAYEVIFNKEYLSTVELPEEE